MFIANAFFQFIDTNLVLSVFLQTEHHPCIVSMFLIKLGSLSDLSYFFAAYSCLEVPNFLTFSISLKRLPIIFSLVVAISSILIDLYRLKCPGYSLKLRVNVLAALFLEVLPLLDLIQIIIVQLIEPFFDVIFDLKMVQLLFNLFLFHHSFNFLDYLSHSYSIVAINGQFVLLIFIKSKSLLFPGARAS